MKINKYPDGASYVVADSTDTNITFKINTYQELWYLNQYVDAMNSRKITPVITIPNLLDAQADRRFKLGESSGLKLVCKFLNSMDATFIIIHPHNPEVVEALMDNVFIINNTGFITKVIYNELYPGPGFPNTDMYDNLILMSADAGGYKPLMKLCEAIKWKGEVYSASKSRKYEGGVSILTQVIDREDFKGKDILIIDDISVKGGTFKGLSKLLKERNTGKLYLAVTHMTVQNLGGDSVINHFDKVFTTNSKFNKYFALIENGFDTPLQVPENLTILSI